MKTKVFEVNHTKALYAFEVQHEGLNVYRVIKGNDKFEVLKKVQDLVARLDERWKRQLQKEEKGKKTEQADLLTQEAKETLEALETILAHTLEVDDRVCWKDFLLKENFPEPKPKRPRLKEIPSEPDKAKFKPEISFVDKLFSSRKEKKLNDATMAYSKAYQDWELSCKETKAENETLTHRYNSGFAEWEERKNKFIADVRAHNEKTTALKADYEAEKPRAVEEYCKMVLDRSEYPDYFPQDFELDFNPESRILLIEYQIPTPEDIPTVKEIKYIASKDTFKEAHISKTEAKRIYNEVGYQIALRTIHEVFESDVVDAISAVVFNGKVDTRDKATGKLINPCILSVLAQKDEFLAIDLEHVSPKECFKRLKGIGSSSLQAMAPINPILTFDKNDSRFVEGKDILEGVQEGANLAAMDWQDFEHLIREIFEKEFSTGGGDVKVTQASKDGGVDAIAFDPDPLRGGKIVIQAKRYTNTVQVAAVRDLYGTLVSEGATKGILITTADYGPDSYEFAKGKPLTLLNGGHLLHLLEKHGHQARIDLQEAKKELQNS